MKKLLSLLMVLVFAGTAFANEVLKNDDFSKGLRGWNSPNYWAGTLTNPEENGRKYFLLESGTRGTEVFGRALGYSKGIELYPGYQIKIQARVKGAGTMNWGLLVYNFGSGSPAYLRCKSVSLTDSFQDVSDTLELKARYRMILPFIEVTGAGKVMVESYKMERLVAPANSIKVETPLQVVKALSDMAPITFATAFPNQEVTVSQKSGNKVVVKTAKTDAKGKLVVTPEVQGEDVIEVTVGAKGAAASGYVAVDSAENYSKTDAIAKKIKLAKPLSILIIGDSLSDFYRGYNYVDRVNHWLNKYNPGKVAIRNAGVGGDFLIRVEQRLWGTRPKASAAYRQDMYKGLFEQEYDYIFIFLGQNDSRCQRTQKYAKPLVAPAAQEKSFRNCYNFIRRYSQAKIVLIAPSPSDVSVFEARDKKYAPNVEIVMYGKKEFVDAFDATNRKLCQELKLDYVDILTPMRAISPIGSLYVEDGVHLSPKGGQVIADEVLKYFAK